MISRDSGRNGFPPIPSEMEEQRCVLKHPRPSDEHLQFRLHHTLAPISAKLFICSPECSLCCARSRPAEDLQQCLLQDRETPVQATTQCFRKQVFIHQRFTPSSKTERSPDPDFQSLTSISFSERLRSHSSGVIFQSLSQSECKGVVVSEGRTTCG
jgi:hypothetical protein